MLSRTHHLYKSETLLCSLKKVTYLYSCCSCKHCSPCQICSSVCENLYTMFYKERCFCLPTLVYNYVGEETGSPALYQTFLTAKAQTLIYSK